MSESGTISRSAVRRSRRSTGSSPATRRREDANPDIKTLNGYSQDFLDQAKCKEIALDQISRGSDVVFQVAGGAVSARSTRREGAGWGIGVDADQSYLGAHILTSATRKVDVGVYQTIEPS